MREEERRKDEDWRAWGEADGEEKRRETEDTNTRDYWTARLTPGFWFLSAPTWSGAGQEKPSRAHSYSRGATRRRLAGESKRRSKQLN